MHVNGNRVSLSVLHLPDESERVDLELNYAARDFYYIPIQMTSANTGVKPRAVGQATGVCVYHLRQFGTAVGPERGPREGSLITADP